MDVEERCFANYLDPRFKGIHLALVAMKGRIKESIKEKFGEGMHHTDNILDEVDMAPLSPTSKLLHQNQMMNEQQGSKMEQEMAQYEQMISPDRDSNILVQYLGTKILVLEYQYLGFTVLKPTCLY